MTTVTVWRDGALAQVDEAEIGPRPAPLEIPRRTYKADIWRRATDAEAATIDANLEAKGLRMRNLFNDAQHLDHADPLFLDLKEAFAQAFGDQRADELLAPSA